MNTESLEYARSKGKGELLQVTGPGSDGKVTYGILMTLVEKHSEGLVIFDLEGSFVQFNRALVDIFSHTEEGMRKQEWLKMIAPGVWQDGATNYSAGARSLEPLLFRDKELEFINGKGKRTVVNVNGGLLEEMPGGNHVLYGSFRDITAAHKRVEELTEMARKLISYTSDLEKELRTKKKELESSRRALDEQSSKSGKVKDGMQHLLTSINNQKADLEKRIAGNFSLTIEPIVEQLKELSASDSERLLLDVLLFNMCHITSYFGLNLAQQNRNLTPREMQICQMLRAGQQTRQIARALGLARQTVIVHRKNIRKKLGIKGGKENLITYLTDVL